jgi:hypothetical protein
MDFVLSLVAEGYHPSVIVVERVESKWQVRVTLDDWCSLGDGGETNVRLDRNDLPPGIAARATERMADQVRAIECESSELAETWLREIAGIGKAPDYANVAGRWITKPVAWLREPIRSALLRSSGRAT